MKHHVFIIVCTGILASAPHAAPAASSSTGQEARDIKALSLGEVNGYLSGQGLGLAKAAELNGYPGPKHVIELSSELALTPEQRERTQALFASMQARAIDLGRALVEEERKLDRLFASKSATPELLSSSLARIGDLQARLRGAHLQAFAHPCASAVSGGQRCVAPSPGTPLSCGRGV